MSKLETNEKKIRKPQEICRKFQEIENIKEKQNGNFRTEKHNN